MFNSTKSRYASNCCFGSFVPDQRVNSLHQRLVEMSTNEVEAWNPSTPKYTRINNWNDEGVAFNGYDHFPSESFFEMEFQTEHQSSFTFPDATQYSTANHGETNMISSVSQRPSRAEHTSMACVDSRPMIGNSYPPWNLALPSNCIDQSRIGVNSMMVHDGLLRSSFEPRNNIARYYGLEKVSLDEQPIQRPRQMFPTEPELTRDHTQALLVPSDDFPPMLKTRESSAKVKSLTKSASLVGDFPSPAVSQTFSPKKIGPKAAKNNPWLSSKPISAAPATQFRSEKDTFLVNSKLAGMSYKEIRRMGKFTEAESTLRGRYRTLTKHKEARVRKPEWDDNDVRLLKKAVRKLASGSDIARGKVPWKQVADYIANNGGSYHFGNATCRKRWDELHE